MLLIIDYDAKVRIIFNIAIYCKYYFICCATYSLYTYIIYSYLQYKYVLQHTDFIVQYIAELKDNIQMVEDAGFGWLEIPKWSLLVPIGSWGKMATGKGCLVTMIVEVRKYGI